MTCKDCIHYDNKIQEKTGKVEYHLCTEDEPNWKFVKNIDKPCKQFECVGNALDALDKMRDATPEELESVDNYIKSISKPTGYNFYDSWESVSK